MNNNMIGYKDVYQFTLVQTLKSKPYRSFALVLFFIALLSMPLIEIVTNGLNREEDKTSDIAKVYVIDETGLPEADYSSIKEESSQYKDIIFEYTNKSAADIEDEIINDNKDAILLHITSDTGFFNLRFIRPASGDISENEVIRLASHVQELFSENMIKNIGVSAEQKAKLEEAIITDYQFYSAETEEFDEEDSKLSVTFEEYNIVLIIFVVVMILISYGGSGIATTIVTEKSTKLIEILLTRVRPMAIIVGKVLAMLTTTLIQLLFVGLGFGFSSIIYKAVFASDSYLPEFVVSALESNILQNISFASVIVSIIIFVIGFIFYGFLAGLTGATVSKVEELREGMIVYTFLSIIGAYMGLALPIIGIQGSVPSFYAHLAFLLPISSVFITPIYLLFGKVSIAIALLAVLILIIATILVIMFTSKVYQTIILHQGNVIKFKDLITISKTSKEAR